jgi:AcrR family transcriptional regulator
MVTVGSPREPRSDAARNRETLVRVATAAVHREGPRVPMATIAAEAGVGIGTLYRHFSTREELLGYLTHASFERVLANAEAAEAAEATAVGALQRFIAAAISQRNELVLPLHGGPAPTWERTQAVREQVHQVIQRIIDRGRADGTITRDVTPRDIVVFGAMLAQPRRSDPGWDATCLRLLATYLAGLGRGTSATGHLLLVFLARPSRVSDRAFRTTWAVAAVVVSVDHDRVAFRGGE